MIYELGHVHWTQLWFGTAQLHLETLCFWYLGILQKTFDKVQDQVFGFRPQPSIFEASAHGLVPARHGSSLGSSYVYYLNIRSFWDLIYKVQNQCISYSRIHCFWGPVHTVWSRHGTTILTMEESSNLDQQEERRCDSCLKIEHNSILGHLQCSAHRDCAGSYSINTGIKKI